MIPALHPTSGLVEPMANVSVTVGWFPFHDKRRSGLDLGWSLKPADLKLQESKEKSWRFAVGSQRSFACFGATSAEH